jgi:hypothetical protein
LYDLQGAVGLDVGCCGHWQIRGQDDLGLDRRMSFGPSKTTWITSQISLWMNVWLMVINGG